MTDTLRSRDAEVIADMAAGLPPPPTPRPITTFEVLIGGWWHPALLFAFVALTAFFFAKVEIQIEGANGWAANLPTWRIESHWLLDIFWGGRPMTGYHAWVFSFMALIFHLPILMSGRWTISREARILGSLMLFWIIEDVLWFVLNPAFGMAQFGPGQIPWHRHWVLGVPTDYVTFTVIGTALYLWSFAGRPFPGSDRTQP